MIKLRLLSFLLPNPRIAFDACDDAPAEPRAESPGSGWYESSLDLRRGLDVIEHDMAWPDTQPAAWPVCRQA